MDATAIFALLTAHLGTALGKFALKNYLKDTAAGAVSESLLDLAKKKIEDYATQRKAARQFEEIGDRVCKELLPLFEEAVRRDQINPEAIISELGETLQGRIEPEFFLTHDLDPKKLTAALDAARPLRREMFMEAETRFYDLALEKTVRYLVEVVHQLPKYEPTLAAQSLQRLSHLDTVLEEVLKGVREIEQRVTSIDFQDREQRYEADYRLAVMRKFDFVELFGADITFEARRHSLSVAYVSLNLQSQAKGNDDAQEILSVEQALDQLGSGQGRLLIRGEAGMGKSTLFRWATIQAACGEEEFESNQTYLYDLKSLNFMPIRLARWRLRVPFLIRLRDCDRGRLPAPKDFPTLIAKEIGDPPADWVTQMLKSGRGLILLDGVDEVPNDLRDAVIPAEIEAIVRAFPDNYFLVSTRPEAVPPDWLAALEFREARINPMLGHDVRQFIEKWHEAVARQLECMGKPSGDLKQLASDLADLLPDHPSIARLATNPLLCAMICALHRDRGQKLPESQSELCEALCQMLLHRRELESGLGLEQFPEPYRRLSYTEKKVILRDLAYHMVVNGKSTIAVEEAEKKIAQALRHSPNHTETDAPIIGRCLIERSGMLRESRPGHIDFLHNTFKEYLAAGRFVEEGQAGLLAREALDPAWQPVALFAAATEDPKFATALIEQILPPPLLPTSQPGKRKSGSATPPDPIHARKVLALRCRAAAFRLDPDLIERLNHVLKDLFPPRTMAVAEALAACGEEVVPFLHYHKDLKAVEAAACVRALRLIGGRRAERCLHEYFNDERDSVVNELVQAVNLLSLKKIRDALICGETLPDAIRKTINDLTPLSDLTALQSLYLGGAKVSNLQPLASLTALQSLDLVNTDVNDLQPLANLTALRSLNIHYTKVNDLQPLANLTALQSLYLGFTKVKDLQPLASLTALQSLGLCYTKVKDLQPLASLTALQSLNLGGTAVSNLQPLASLTALQSLNLVGTAVRDLQPLANLTALQSLDLGGTTARDLQPLANLTTLQSLHLRYTQVTDLTPLSGLASLKLLDLREVPNVRNIPFNLTKVQILR